MRMGQQGYLQCNNEANGLAAQYSFIPAIDQYRAGGPPARGPLPEDSSGQSAQKAVLGHNPITEGIPMEGIDAVSGNLGSIMSVPRMARCYVVSPSGPGRPSSCHGACQQPHQQSFVTTWQVCYNRRTCDRLTLRNGALCSTLRKARV